MPHRTFFWFIIPSLLAMVLFIALPVISVIVQSLHVEHEKVLISSENCGPFGCKKITTIDVAATDQLRSDRPLGQFSGFDNYTNRSHLALGNLSYVAFVAARLRLPIRKRSGEQGILSACCLNDKPRGANLG